MPMHANEKGNWFLSRMHITITNHLFMDEEINVICRSQQYRLVEPTSELNLNYIKIYVVLATVKTSYTIMH